MVDKKEKKKEKETKDKKIKSKKKLTKKEIQDKQVMWAIILMASIILIIILVPFITKNYINKFVYFNLDFQKTKLGDIIFYSTRVPIIDKSGEIRNSYTMNFRNNPKKLEEIEFIPFKNDVDYVYFKKDKIVYISLNPKMEPCEDTTIALIPFAGFLRDFAKQNISSAVSDENYAIENDMPYVTCEDFPDNTVIYVNSGEKTEISKPSNNCYELIYDDCEIIKVIERFELLVLEKYMSYFVKKDESVLDFFNDILSSQPEK